jgi:hypothetical protein
MGGIYIDCGSFTGSDDKSGRPILFVLEGMQAVGDDEACVLLSYLMREVEAWLWISPPVEFKIAPHDAQVLLPCIHEYRRIIEAALPSTDIVELIPVLNKETSDGICLRGPAHQYECLRDLERAFETAIAEHQPVVLTWD